jgi:hypothetical protein
VLQAPTLPRDSDEIAGDMRMAHNKELHNLYSFTCYYSNEQTKEDEMDGTYSTHERRDVHIELRFGSLKGRHHLEDLDVDERIHWINETW